MRYTAFCIIDDPDKSAAILADLHRAGFTDAEISTAAAPAPHLSDQDPSSDIQADGDAPPQPFGGRSMVGAALGLIAGLSAIAIPETATVSQASALQATTVDHDTVAAAPSAPTISPVQERVRSIAYHLQPGRTLISVQTCNSYEIATIIEIFQAGGSLHSEHIATEVAPDEQQAPPTIATPIHSHATILTERLRETV